MDYCDCGEQAVVRIGENDFCEMCWKDKKRRAKYERDKHVVEYVGGASKVDSLDKPDKDSLGINPDNYDKIVPKPEVERPDFQLLWEHELDDYEEHNEWLVDRIIPAKSVGIWTGKRSTYKTFLLLDTIFCVAAGIPFLNKPSVKGKVIYLDKENGVHTMRTRKNMVKKGLELEGNYDVGFICFSTIKIDKFSDMKKIEGLIEEHKPKLLIVDTYRRGISFDENDAGAVSALFVDTLRPLVEKYDLSIILIHHDRKGNGKSDEMDEIRGSSDLANYADFILKNERRGNSIIIKQLKNRNAPEIDPIQVKIETDETSYIKFVPQEMKVLSKDEQCAEIITMWIVKKGLNDFSTGEAKEAAFLEGVKKQNFYNGLKVMVDRGILNKNEKGRYEVISKDLKLII